MHDLDNTAPATAPATAPVSEAPVYTTAHNP